MIPTGIGLRWQPGQDTALGRSSAGPATPSQGPAKLLSFRLPSRSAPNSLAPQALLEGQGSAAIGGDLNGFLTLLSQALSQSNGASGSSVLDLLRGTGGGASMPASAAVSKNTPQSVGLTFQEAPAGYRADTSQPADPLPANAREATTTLPGGIAVSARPTTPDPLPSSPWTPFAMPGTSGLLPYGMPGLERYLGG